MNKSKHNKKQSLSTFIAIVCSLFLCNQINATQLDVEHESRAIPELSIETITPQDKLQKLQFTGIANVKNNIFITPETTGTVKTVQVNKGDFVKADQILSSIDRQTKEKKIAQAQAMLVQRQLEYKAAASLHKTGYNSEVVLSASLSALRTAELDLEKAKLDLEHAEIRAPFSGIINQVNIKQGMVVHPMTAAINIIECSNYFVKIHVPEKIINKLKDNPAEVKLPTIKKIIKGQINAVSMGASNHSYAVEINMTELNGKCMNIVGMNADVEIILDKVPSYRIPPYALSLSDAGILGIKTLNDQQIVEFHPVEILEEDADGSFWVTTSTKGKLNLIANGHSYVQEGQLIS